MSESMKPDWTSDCGRIRLYCADCLDVLPHLTGVDAVVTDPPYGISYDQSHDKYKNGINRGGIAEWDIAPFDPSPIVALGFPTVLWGGNCFASRLPDHPGWLSWVKTVRNGSNVRQAEMELAWTNCVTRPQVFRHLWVGAYRDSEIGIPNVHPTQKPVAVMEWTLGVIKAKEDALVADFYMGSGTTCIACIRTGRRFIGIEKEPKYFQIAKERIQRELQQQLLPL